jgi:hypothetical protein
MEMSWPGDVIRRARSLATLLVRADAVTLVAPGDRRGLVFHRHRRRGDRRGEPSARRVGGRLRASSGDLPGPLGPPWLEEVIRDVTALGGRTVLVLLIGAVTGYPCMRRAYRSMWLVLAGSLGALLVSTLHKGFFHRLRPALAPDLTHVTLSSFPARTAALRGTRTLRAVER